MAAALAVCVRYKDAATERQAAPAARVRYSLREQWGGALYKIEVEKVVAVVRLWVL